MKLPVFFLLFVSLTASTFSSASTDPGISACLMVSDVILFRGERFNNDYRNRFRDETNEVLADISNTDMGRRMSDLAGYLTLVVDMPRDELFPWRVTTDVSGRITPILELMPPRPQTDADIARLIAYLNMQYMFRAFVGTYELPREINASFVSWDESGLVPVIDQYLAAGDSGRYTRWKFLKASFLDMNSASATMMTVSGKAYAPVVVDFHSRALISDLYY